MILLPIGICSIGKVDPAKVIPKVPNIPAKVTPSRNTGVIPIKITPTACDEITSKKVARNIHPILELSG